MQNWRLIMNRPAEDLIFDRTIEDVENATLKGQYNASDLNRVESWCEYLKTELNIVGYDINITTKTNWQQSDMRTSSEMERIRTNIKKIMQGYYYVTSIEQNAEYFNYVKANNWEKILNEMYELMFGMQNWYIYGGVARGGQNRVWQHRFRQLYGYGLFATNLAPTTWTQPNVAEEIYKGTNTYGEWTVYADESAISSHYSYYAFDGNTSTFFRTRNGERVELTIELPQGIAIKPTEITISTKQTKATTNIMGYLPETETWELVTTLNSGSGSTQTTEVLPVQTSFYFTKFMITVIPQTTNVYASLFEFEITGGEIKNVL